MLNLDKKVLDNKRYYRKLQQTVVHVYSNGAMECAKCGEDNLIVLQIDHVKDDGYSHRKIVGGHVYEWLIRNNFPVGFQVLCANCNWDKRFKIQNIRRKKFDESRALKRKYDIEKRVELRESIINHYTRGQMCCAKCGENKYCVLQIDHKFGGGGRHKREVNCVDSIAFYKWIVRNNFPKGLQILCANCNTLKRYRNGECCKRK